MTQNFVTFSFVHDDWTLSIYFISLIETIMISRRAERTREDTTSGRFTKAIVVAFSCFDFR